MRALDIKFRPIERKAFCRGCDKTMERGEMVVSTYSFRNRGQDIYFCIPCSKEIGRLANTQMDLLDEQT